MYKKINATKNNSLKKASILIAVAMFASCVVFVGSERLGTDNDLVVSAMGHFGGLGRGRMGQGLLRDVLNENQKENYDLLEENFWLVNEAVWQFLSRDNLKISIDDQIPSYGVKVLNGVVREVVSVLKKTPAYAAVFKDRDRGRNRTLLKELESYARGIRNFQLMLGAYIEYIGAMLSMDRIKNPEKLEGLEKKLKESVKCPSDIFKIANIDRIKNAGGLALSQAKDMVKEAKFLFWSNGDFAQERRGADDASDWSLRLSRDKDVNSKNYHLLVVLQTLLHINKEINRTNGVAISSIISTKLQQLFKFVASQGGTATELFFMDKSVGFYALADPSINRPDLAVMILALAALSGDSGFAGVDFDGIERVAAICKQCASQMAGADGGHIKDVKDFFDIASNKASEATAGSNNLSFDVGGVLGASLGHDIAKIVLKPADNTLRTIYGPEFVKQIEAAREDLGLSEEQVANIVAGADQFNQDADTHRFVKSNGELASTTVEFAPDKVSPDDPQKVAAISAELVKKASSILAMPPTLRYLAVLDVLTKDLSDSMGNLKLDNALDASAFSVSAVGTSARDILSKIASIKEGANKVVKTVAEAKSKDVTKNKDNKKSADSAGGNKQITNVLSLNSANQNSNKIGVELDGKVVKISNLPENVAKISAVLCPKTAADGKTGNKDIDLPVVDVANGSTTIDLSSHLNASGNYELHIRNAVLDPASKNIIRYDFLQKEKFAYAVDKFKVRGLCKAVPKQGESPRLDYSTVQAIYNENKSITIRIKCKSGATVPPMTAAIFQKGAQPNLEKDKYGMQEEQRNGERWVTVTTPNNMTGDVEFHIYAGEIEGQNYDGEVLVKTSDVTDITVNKEVTPFSLVNKNSSEDLTDKVNLDEKVVKLVLPYSVFDDDDAYYAKGGDVEYEITDSSGNVVVSGTQTLTYDTNKKDRYGSPDGKLGVYTGAFKIPRAKDSGYRLVIYASGGEIFESRKSVGSDTSIGEELEFSRTSRRRSRSVIGSQRLSLDDDDDYDDYYDY